MTQKRQIYNGVNRTIRAIIGAILVLVIAFAAISVCQNICKSVEGRYYRPEDLYTFEGHKIDFGQAQPAD